MKCKFNSLTQLAVLICLTLGFVSTSHAVKKVDAAKENLKDVHEKIEALKKELDASKDAHQDAADELKQSETAISLAQKKIHEINKKQKKNNTTLNKLKTQSLRIHDELTEQQQQLNKQLYQQYLHGNQSYTQLILENKDPNKVARDLKYYAYIAKARSALISGMHENLNKIESLNTETATTLQEVEALKAKQLAEKADLEKQKLEKAKIVKSLSQKIAAQRNEIGKLKRDEKSLSNLVARLNQMAELARQKSVAKNKSSKTKPSRQTSSNRQDPDESNAGRNNVIAKNETLPSGELAGISFSNLRGKLRLPVRGDVSNRFGATRADTGISWKGIFIKSAEGNEVKSVARGRVVFADWMRGFGNLIIVDHGSGYMSFIW